MNKPSQTIENITNKDYQRKNNHILQDELKNFEKWLKTLEYATATIYASVHYVNDFFFYLKNLNISYIEEITEDIINSYYKHLQERKNKRKNGGLSVNYIAGNINAIKRFSRYLQETEKKFFEVLIKTKPDKETPKIILSKREIKSLYRACGSDYIGIRDRAILSIYYGCGLRRSEGVSLNVKDVLLKEKLIFVKSGKGYRERYVPMSETVKEDLENYIYIAIEKLKGYNHKKREKKEKTSEALFLSLQGKRMSGNAIIGRIKTLAITAKINKPVGLHTLRHSIATHLLQGGMTLEEVSEFLGHSSLESTQIYTHLIHE